MFPDLKILKEQFTAKLRPFFQDSYKIKIKVFFHTLLRLKFYQEILPCQSVNKKTTKVNSSSNSLLFQLMWLSQTKIHRMQIKS